MVLHESLKLSGVWGQNSNSIVRHMKKDLDIMSTYPHFTIHPCTLTTVNSCSSLKMLCLFHVHTTPDARPLLRKSSTKTQVKDWFLCDVFLHSLRKWLLPLPYSFLFHTGPSSWSEKGYFFELKLQGIAIKGIGLDFHLLLRWPQGQSDSTKTKFKCSGTFETKAIFISPL